MDGAPLKLSSAARTPRRNSHIHSSLHYSDKEEKKKKKEQQTKKREGQDWQAASINRSSRRATMVYNSKDGRTARWPHTKRRRRQFSFGTKLITFIFCFFAITSFYEGSNSSSGNCLLVRILRRPRYLWRSLLLSPGRGVTSFCPQITAAAPMYIFGKITQTNWSVIEKEVIIFYILCCQFLIWLFDNPKRNCKMLHIFIAYHSLMCCYCYK